MKTKLALLWVVAALTASAIFSYAEDLTTLDGEAFTNITEISKYPAQMFFTYGGKRTSVSISNLPADFRIKHGITIITNAPTNSVAEFRMVGKVKYDVSQPPFITITIPARSQLLGADRIPFTGQIKPITARFSFYIGSDAGSLSGYGYTGSPVVI